MTVKATLVHYGKMHVNANKRPTSVFFYFFLAASCSTYEKPPAESWHPLVPLMGLLVLTEVQMFLPPLSPWYTLTALRAQQCNNLTASDQNMAEGSTCSLIEQSWSPCQNWECDSHRTNLHLVWWVAKVQGESGPCICQMSQPCQELSWKAGTAQRGLDWPGEAAHNHLHLQDAGHLCVAAGKLNCLHNRSLKSGRRGTYTDVVHTSTFSSKPKRMRCKVFMKVHIQCPGCPANNLLKKAGQWGALPFAAHKIIHCPQKRTQFLQCTSSEFSFLSNINVRGGRRLICGKFSLGTVSCNSST